MDEVAEKIIAILRKNMRDPNKEITLDTKLTELEIEVFGPGCDRFRYRGHFWHSNSVQCQ